MVLSMCIYSKSKQNEGRGAIEHYKSTANVKIPTSSNQAVGRAILRPVATWHLRQKNRSIVWPSHSIGAIRRGTSFSHRRIWPPETGEDPWMKRTIPTLIEKDRERLGLR